MKDIVLQKSNKLPLETLLFSSYKIKIRIPQDAMCCEKIQENVDKQGHLFGYNIIQD